MVQNSIKDLLKKMVAVQKIDVELFSYKRELKEKPQALNVLKGQFDKKKTKCLELEAKLLEIERTRKAKELDLKVKEQGIVTANSQLMSLKTNKEYQAKLFEIENMKADKSLLEDEILKFLDDSEKMTGEIKQEKSFLDDEEKKYLAEKETVDAAISQVQDKARILEAQRKEAMEGIDKDVLAVYERIVENRDGVALVPVVNNSCGGCFMNVPPQVINKIKMYDELVRCEICARYLYLEDEL